MPKIMEIEQQVERGFTLEHVKKVIEEHSEAISRYLYILHDKDVYTEDGTRSDGTTYKAGEPKTPHIHVFLDFGGKDYKFDNVSKWFDVPVQQCTYIKGKRYVYGIRYAFHINAPEKHQYGIEEGFYNFDVEEFLQKEAKKDDDNAKTAELIEKIVSEEIPCSEFHQYVSTSLYLRNKVDFDRAFELVSQRYIKKILDGTIRRCNMESNIDGGLYTKFRSKFETAFRHRLEIFKQEKNRTMNCIYITGEAGTGKTTFAKQLAEEKGLTYFISSGSNDVLDGYTDEECVILDDLRPSCLGLSDLLKMLDNNTSSSINSRYYNKTLVQCSLIIITTVLPLEQFFRNVFKDDNEPLVQLKRRCMYMYNFINEEEIEIYVYDSAKRDHVLVGYMPNPIKYLTQEKPKTDEERFEMAADFLGSFGRSLVKTAEHSKQNASQLSAFRPSEEQKRDIERDRKRIAKTMAETFPDSEQISLDEKPSEDE